MYLDDLLKRVATLTEENEKLKQENTHDDITTLYNKRFIMNRGQEELRRSMRYRHELSVIYFDINNFKAINDTCGHAIGDRVIAEAGLAIVESIRPGIDLAARLSGDEFLVIMPETDMGNAHIVALRIQSKFSNSEFLKSALFTDSGLGDVTLSPGIASWPNSPQPYFDKLVNQADQNMYEHKRQQHHKEAA